MPFEVVGTGMIAGAFRSRANDSPNAIVCASGVADSGCTDESAFERERTLVRELAQKAIAQDSCLVYFSGAPVYGLAGGVHVETAPSAPVSPYGRHKLACEEMIVRSGARFLVLRLPNVVGSVGNPKQLVPSLVSQVSAGHVVVRSGATRDLLDVDDIVAIVEALVRQGTTEALLNVASGVSTPVATLAEQIAIILGVRPNFEVVDGGDRQEFSTELVRRLLRGYPSFGSGYPTDVLTRYVPSIHRALGLVDPAGQLSVAKRS